MIYFHSHHSDNFEDYHSFQWILYFDNNVWGGGISFSLKKYIMLGFEATCMLVSLAYFESICLRFCLCLRILLTHSRRVFVIYIDWNHRKITEKPKKKSVCEMSSYIKKNFQNFIVNYCNYFCIRIWGVFGGSYFRTSNYKINQT